MKYLELSSPGMWIMLSTLLFNCLFYLSSLWYKYKPSSTKKRIRQSVLDKEKWGIRLQATDSVAKNSLWLLPGESVVFIVERISNQSKMLSKTSFTCDGAKWHRGPSFSHPAANMVSFSDQARYLEINFNTLPGVLLSLAWHRDGGITPKAPCLTARPTLHGPFPGLHLWGSAPQPDLLMAGKSIRSLLCRNQEGALVWTRLICR